MGKDKNNILGFTVDTAVSHPTVMKGLFFFHIWSKKGAKKGIPLREEGTFNRHRELSQSCVTLEDLDHGS